MNLPFFIAKRYLFASRRMSVINIISAISVGGVALASFAMICILSVFNGFHGLVARLFTDFDPELKIVASRGKTFEPHVVSEAVSLDCVELALECIEEQAMVRYKDNQQIVTLKAVPDNYYELTNIQNTLRGQGSFMLHDDVSEYGVLGIGLMSKLDCGVQSLLPFTVFVPKSGVRINTINPQAGLSMAEFFSPGVIFQVNQAKYDDNYVLVSLGLARQLLGYSTEITSMDIKLKPNVNLKKAKREIQSVLGSGFIVQDRFDQQADVFKVVRIEKMVSFLFLTFVLLIACINIIGSLVMLMVQKRTDATVLLGLGLTPQDIGRIFFYNGILISVCGAIAGLLLGVIAALLQQSFGFIPLGSGDFVVDAYPVQVQFADVVVVLVTVVMVSIVSVLPIRRLASRMN